MLATKLLNLTRYGDKAPKSCCGRIFAMIWIMVGVTVCSLLTATLTTAFNNISADQQIELAGKKVDMDIADSLLLPRKPSQFRCSAYFNL